MTIDYIGWPTHTRGTSQRNILLFLVLLCNCIYASSYIQCLYLCTQDFVPIYLLNLHVFVCLSVYLFVYLYVGLPTPSACLSIYLHICMCVCLYVCLSVCLSV